MRTRTIYVNLERLNALDVTPLIIRLMMANNDIILANQCLVKFREEQNPIQTHIKKGAAMYFVRLQCGHLNEAMPIIAEIKRDQRLYSEVQRCSQVAQESFKMLTDCLKNGPDHIKFHRFIGQIRHNTVFHYDYYKKLVPRALSDRAGGADGRLSRITLSDNVTLRSFELADDIIDSIVCRQICGVPRNADLREEIDRFFDWGNELCNSLLIFPVEFITRYILEHAAI